MNMLSHKIADLLSYTIAIIFLSSAILKSLYPIDFYRFAAAATSIDFANNFLGIVLFSECVIAVMLMLQPARHVGLVIAAVYVLAGTIWYTILRQRGFSGGCGCFGGYGGGAQFTYMRNGLIVAMSGIALVLSLEKVKTENKS